jgi:hypothetical protein
MLIIRLRGSHQDRESLTLAGSNWCLSDQVGDQLTKTLQSKKNWCSEHKRVSWQQIKCLQNSVNATKLCE